MIKLQLIPFIPFIATLLALLCNKYLKLENLSDKISTLSSSFLAILFLTASLGLKNLHNSTIFTLLKLPNDFSFALIFNAEKTLLLLTLGVFWLTATIYCNRYFCLMGDKKKQQFNVLLPTFIGFLSAIILSANLLTALVFYQFLALTIYFTVDYFSPKHNIKAAKYFGYSILGASFLLFVALILTFKISGEVNFMKDGVFERSAINISEFGWLLFFYVLGIAAIAFAPFYLLFKNLYSLNLPAIILALISFGFASTIFLFKIIAYIFGTKLFAIFMPQINQHHLITILIALNLLASSLLAIFSKNLKQILILLFFNQLIALIMGFLVFGISSKKMQIVIASFVLCQLLIFIVVGNISLYLQHCKGQSLNGIFYKLRLTILALIFALLNCSGLIPAIGGIEKYWLFKEAFNDQNLFNAAVLAGNILICLALATKIIYPMLEILKKNNDESSKEMAQNVAKDIETDLNLISPILILPLILFFLAFFAL